MSQQIEQEPRQTSFIINFPNYNVKPLLAEMFKNPPLNKQKCNQNNPKYKEINRNINKLTLKKVTTSNEASYPPMTPNVYVNSKSI